MLHGSLGTLAGRDHRGGARGAKTSSSRTVKEQSLSSRDRAVDTVTVGTSHGQIVVVGIPSTALQRGVARRLWAVLAAASSAATALVPRTSSTSREMLWHVQYLAPIRAGQRRSTCNGLSGSSRQSGQGTPSSRPHCTPGIPGSGSAQSHACRTGHRTTARPSISGHPPPTIGLVWRLGVVDSPHHRPEPWPVGQLAMVVSRAVLATARPIVRTSTGTSC